MSSSLSEPTYSKSNAKQNLNKAFNLLKSHASKVAKFTLQWQELEDHFRHIDSLIDSRLQQLPQNTNTHQQNQTLVASNGNTNGTTDNNPTENATPNSPSGLTGIPVTDGNSLMLFVNKHRSDNDKLLAGICNALKGLENPGKLVLESLQAFHGVDMKLSIFRRCCVILLEGFMKVGATVGPQEKEEAMRLALEWKAIMRTGTGSWGVLGFLMIVAVFGLIGNFDADEIFKLFDDVVKRIEAPELFRALGFADKAPDLIQLLISQNKRLVAINYIYAFELVDKFPPVPLLKAHARCAEEVTKTLLKNKSNSLTDKQVAITREILALKGILRVVHSRKLVPEYSVVGLHTRIQQLKNKGKELLTVAKASNVKHQAQKWGRNKQISPPMKAQPTTQPNNKYPQTSAPRVLASSAQNINVPTENPSYQQSASMFADQGVRDLTPSAAVDSQRTNRNGFAGESSSIPRVQPFPHQPADLVANHVALELTPRIEYNRIATSTHFTPHTSSAVGTYSSLCTAPSNSHMNLIGKLASSESTSTATHYSLSAGQYGVSNIAATSNGQLEWTGRYNTTNYNHDIPVMPRYYHGPVLQSNAGIGSSPSCNVHVPYYHPGTQTISGYGRPVFYGARHGALPRRPPFTYHH